MSKWTKSILIAVTALTLAACGKSGDKDTVNQTNDLVKEYNSLVKEVNSKTPNYSWTETELAAYEAKLNRMQIIYNKLMRSSDKYDNINISGQNPAPFITIRKQTISNIRETRVAGTSGQTAITFDENRFRLLNADNQDLLINYFALGAMTEDTSLTDLQQAEGLLREALVNMAEQDKMIEASPSYLDKETLDLFSTLKKRIGAELEKVETLIKAKTEEAA